MSNGMRSILVVDRDRESAESLSKRLTEAGFLVKISDDGAHARTVLQHRPFDVLIIDVASARSGEVNLMHWVGRLLPRPRIVATGQELPASETGEVFYALVDMFLEKPLQVDMLIRWLLASNRRASFSGAVDEVDLIEYIQYVLLSGRNTVMEITSKSGTKGLLFLRQGEIVHSLCGVLQGEEALFRCLCFDGGRFRHLPWSDPAQMSINKPGTFLLMEAARRRDEIYDADSGPREES